MGPRSRIFLLPGKSPTDFRIDLRFDKSRMRFSWVSPEYMCRDRPSSFNKRRTKIEFLGGVRHSDEYLIQVTRVESQGRKGT